MYIFKNAKIGGKVVPHKDGTYLFTENGLNLVGLWFPMVDVSKKNGCLSYRKFSLMFIIMIIFRTILFLYRP